MQDVEDVDAVRAPPDYGSFQIGNRGSVAEDYQPHIEQQNEDTIHEPFDDQQQHFHDGFQDNGRQDILPTDNENEAQNPDQIKSADDGIQVVQSDLSISTLKLSQIGVSPIVENPKPKFMSPDSGSRKGLHEEKQQEFFMLSVLALKMSHVEEYDAEYIHEADAPQLFNEAKKQGIPFHKWYGWLDNRFKFLAEAHKQQQEIVNQNL